MLPKPCWLNHIQTDHSCLHLVNSDVTTPSSLLTMLLRTPGGAMRLRVWVAATLFVLSVPMTSAAQGEGRFAGTVRDGSGASVAGAVVSVKNQRTGEERSQRTTDSGAFLIPNLKPSVYTVRAVKDGFTPIEYTEIPIAVGQELFLDFEFKPAGLSETVIVTASSPVIDLSSARMGVNVSQRE